MKGSVYFQIWWLLPAHEEGEEAVGRNLKICWFFCLFACFLTFCLFVLLNLEREEKKPICCTGKNHSTFLYFSFLICWIRATAIPRLVLMLIYSLRSSEWRRENRYQKWVFWSYQTGRFLHQMSLLMKVLYFGAITGDWGLLCCTNAQGETIHDTKDILSK